MAWHGVFVFVIPVKTGTQCPGKSMKRKEPDDARLLPRALRAGSVVRSVILLRRPWPG